MLPRRRFSDSRNLHPLQELFVARDHQERAFLARIRYPARELSSLVPARNKLEKGREINPLPFPYAAIVKAGLLPWAQAEECRPAHCGGYFPHSPLGSPTTERFPPQQREASVLMWTVVSFVKKNSSSNLGNCAVQKHLSFRLFIV